MDLPWLPVPVGFAGDHGPDSPVLSRAPDPAGWPGYRPGEAPGALAGLVLYPGDDNAGGGLVRLHGF